MTTLDKGHPDTRFSCSICLDPVNNSPVLTLCGHLFCWDCIFQWLQDGMLEADYDYLSLPPPSNTAGRINMARRICPVCKADCNVQCIIPIYARDSHHSVDQDSQSAKSSDRENRGQYPARPSPPVSYTAQTTSHTTGLSMASSSSSVHADASANINTHSTSSSNPSLFQALLRLQTTIHHLHPSVNPALSFTNSRPPSNTAMGSSATTQYTSETPQSQSEVSQLVSTTNQDVHATSPSPSRASTSPTASNQSSSISVDPTDFLSRLLLLLGSFVILCLLLF